MIGKIELFFGIACRICSTGKFRLFPYRNAKLLQLGTVHEKYKGDKRPEDFMWISPKEAFRIAFR